MTNDRPGLGDLPRLALRLATILAGVHQAGVVHQDVSPANVLLVGAEAEPMLIDFDLATTFAEVRPDFTHHREIVGRLPYLAPEQTGRTGLPVDTRSDLYGLGASLYYLAAGRAPFDDKDPLLLLRDVLARVPQPLTEVVPGVSQGLSDVVARLLEKEPERRYQSAEGLAYDLSLVCASPDGLPRLGERDFPHRLSAPSALVGRAAELEVMRSALDQCRHTTARGVVVVGPPGVGKSALIEQLRPMVTALGGWYVAGKYDQYRRDAAGAFEQALGALGRLLLAEPEAEIVRQRDRLLDGLGPNVGLVTSLIPEFAALLGDDHKIPPNDPIENQARLFQAGLDLLRAVALPRRPIVMVLDDLQWSSPSALGLIDAVHNDDELRGLLLVSAYRDREVDDAHPLTAMLARWKRQGTTPRSLALTNLATADLATLLARMLRLPAAQAVGLAAAVGELTEGNPYDTVELINALRRDGALVLEEGGWRWDDASIRRYIGEGDVADLLKERIERLPAQARRLLETMAYLGGQVRMEVLAAASECPPATVLDLLTTAFEDGLLVIDQGDGSSGAGAVRFCHDRVQQAARDGLDPAARSGLHLAIARRLAAMADLRAEAAEQYLAVVDTLDDPAEQRVAAGLFEMAATDAVKTANDLIAERYLQAATDLWNALGVAPDDPALARLETQRHASLYNLGRLHEADLVYRSIEQRCTDPLDLVDATCLQICSVTNRNRPADAVALGFSLLDRLGFAAPGADPRADVERRLDVMYKWIERVSVAEDTRRPEATDPRALAAARLIRRMTPAALFSDQLIMGWLITEAQRLWAEYGPCDPLVPTIGTVGFGFIWAREDYGTSVRISRHMLAVSEARGYAVVTAQARYLYAVSGCHWFEPVEEDVRHAYAARGPLLRGGDLQSTCFTYYPVVFALLDCGPNLDDLTSEVEAALAFCSRTGNHAAAAVHQIYQQFGRAMRGQTTGPGSFADASFDEDAHEQINPRVQTHLHITRALSAALFGDAERLVRHAETAMQLEPKVRSLYPSVVAHLVGALALAHRVRTAVTPQRTVLLAELDGYRDWLARRAQDAPENFGHLVWLVDAERAWAVDDFRAAATAFDVGLREVETRQRPWHRALIAERAGLFHLAQGMQRSGRRLLAEARLHYDAWGATGKVRELDRVHPFLRHTSVPINDARPRTDDGHSISLSSDDIDLLAILRASQALGSETDLDRLYSSVVEQMSAITGATTVHLLIRDDDAGEWVLPTPGPDRQAVLPVQEAATRGLLPLAAVRYVERTGQPLLVENAVVDDRFVRDPYFTGVDRCSLLGLPIVNKGNLRAVLLLENRLSSGAFSADRLEAVLLISGQLAASVDNALLYRRLEGKVGERTRALQVANKQLETLSLTDPLTGLANRRRFDDALAAGWRDAIASGRSIGIAMVDIDNFKCYNDDFGHLAGDECLREVAHALTSTVRQDIDLVCRYGGEEFAIICPGADEARAFAVAERCRKAVTALARRNTRTRAGLITVSAGVAAMVPNAELSADTLVKVADTALYQAKQNGRNLVSTASDLVGR